MTLASRIPRIALSVMQRGRPGKPQSKLKEIYT